MNLYVDTSALVKRYIIESGSSETNELFVQYPIVGASALTKVEMAAALAKAKRLGWVKEPELSQAWENFLAHWPEFARVAVTQGIVERAATLAWRYGLRGYDAVQLATCLAWQEMMGSGVVLASFDQQLSRAAQLEGLQIWPAVEP